MQTPKTTTDVHGFLGLVNYYQCFVLGFTHVASPLYWLTGKEVLFEWLEACQEVFEALHQALLQAPILSLPVHNQQYVLHTNTLAHTIGVVLLQIDEQGQECMISYASWMLNGAEWSYLATHWECLVVMCFVK